MPKKSAGLLIYRFHQKQLEVLLVHPGGPFWAKKDAGAWSVPKGEINDAEDALNAAKREVQEELGVEVTGDWLSLSAVKQKSGKLIHAWAVEQNVDAANIVSNTFELEWPPKSGKTILVPEVDKAGWFTISDAREKINPAQAAFIDELVNLLS